MGGQDETLAFLRAALAGEQGGPVETIETHISIVLMAGERAWKLKRAVRLPYVDFSTPDLRLAAARTELALNRRTAPGLYLGLRRIARGADGGLRFGDGGGLVDAVVEMRRFDQAMLFDQLARRDALTRPMLTDLARAVARFHAEAEALRMGSAARRRSNPCSISTPAPCVTAVSCRKPRPKRRPHASARFTRVSRRCSTPARGRGKSAAAMAISTCAISACTTARRRRSIASNSTRRWRPSTCSTISPSC
jgi:hypothetical protein